MTTTPENLREVATILDGVSTADGDGVRLTRMVGTPALNMLDPFLLFDAFSSDEPNDYIGGFPSHPHRGFETVTYMLSGKMKHKDSAGNEGIINSGGIQWMTAGKGIIHSEMPQQESGLLAGFQLWVNLPASHKMTTPAYQEVSSSNIPKETLGNAGFIKTIAGTTNNGTEGIIKNTHVDPIYWDVHLSDFYTLNQSIQQNHNAFIYVIKGEIKIGNKFTKVKAGKIAVLTHGCELKISNVAPAHYLVIAGKPLNEPVFRDGPFVMNSKAEIYQAHADYKSGNLA